MEELLRTIQNLKSSQESCQISKETRKTEKKASETGQNLRLNKENQTELKLVNVKKLLTFATRCLDIFLKLVQNGRI